MALGLNKILVSGALSNSAGAYLQTTTVTATTGGVVVPAGTYLMFPTANVTVTANNGSTISTLLANNTGGVLISDGINVFVNAASSNTTVTLVTVNGGQSASSTYA
jgi:hypothetical protein